MTFRQGHRNTHDCAAAGRKGKARSPWRGRMLSTPNARRVECEYQARAKAIAQRAEQRLK